jgi:hypothetical protein
MRRKTAAADVTRRRRRRRQIPSFPEGEEGGRCQIDEGEGRCKLIEEKEGGRCQKLDEERRQI